MPYMVVLTVSRAKTGPLGSLSGDGAPRGFVRAESIVAGAGANQAGFIGEHDSLDPVA